MTIHDKSGALTPKAKKKNGRLFAEWISGTGLHYGSDELTLLPASSGVETLLTRRPISKDDDIFYVSRTDANPDGSGPTVFFGLVRYTERNITEIGFTGDGCVQELLTITKWQEMDGGLRFTPNKKPLDMGGLYSEVGRTLCRMSPFGLPGSTGTLNESKYWTTTFSQEELARKIQGKSTEEIRVARTYKLVVSLFFMGDGGRERTDHFHRLVAENMTDHKANYPKAFEGFLSCYPKELKESLRLAAELITANGEVPESVTPALLAQGTDAPLVAAGELLAEKFMEDAAKAATGDPALDILWPMPDVTSQEEPLMAQEVTPSPVHKNPCPSAFLVENAVERVEKPLFLAAIVPSKADILAMVTEKMATRNNIVAAGTTAPVLLPAAGSLTPAHEPKTIAHTPAALSPREPVTIGPARSLRPRAAIPTLNVRVNTLAGIS